MAVAVVLASPKAISETDCLCLLFLALFGFGFFFFFLSCLVAIHTPSSLIPLVYECPQRECFFLTLQSISSIIIVVPVKRPSIHSGECFRLYSRLSHASCNVTSHSHENGLRCKLKRPKSNLLEAPLARLFVHHIVCKRIVNLFITIIIISKFVNIGGKKKKKGGGRSYPG